ncbi:MAG: translocation/assembly module TamB domain-containing protein [Pseudomonadota bacterium]
MKTILKLVLIGTISIFVLTIGAFSYFTATPTGRSTLASLAEDQIAIALQETIANGSIDIGRIGPGLPGNLVLEDVVVSDTNGEWAFIEKARLSWKPMAFFSNTIDVSLLAIDGARVQRLPFVVTDKTNNENVSEDKPPIDIEYDLTIDQIKLSRFQVNPEIAGLPIISEANARVGFDSIQNTLNINLTSLDLFKLQHSGGDESPTTDQIALASLSGETTVDITDLAVLTELDFSAEPSVLELVPTDALVQAPVTGVISANGSLSDLSIVADIKTPAIQLDEVTTPASKINAEIVGLPSAPKGTIKGTDLGETGSLLLTFETLNAEEIVIQQLNYKAPSFALTGQGASTFDFSKVRAALNYIGDKGASPYPGVTADGSFALDLALDQQKAKIDITTEKFEINNISLSALKVTAAGPIDRIDSQASINAIELQDGLKISEVFLKSRFNLKNAIFANIQNAKLIIDGNPIELLSPMTMTMGESVTIAGLDAKIGDQGRVELDADVSAGRWKADINARDLHFEDSPVTAYLKAKIDTAGITNGLLANGQLSIKSNYPALEEASLKLDAQWDGNTLNLVDAMDDDATDIALNLPVLLQRKPSLGLAIEGPISGKISYADRIQTIASFLPALESVEGEFDTLINLGGTVAEPQINGSFNLRDASYTEFTSGFSLTNINLAATSLATTNGSSLSIEANASGAGQDEKSVFLTANAKIGEEQNIDASLKLDKARFAAAPITSLMTSGTIDLAGNFETLKASGTINIESLNAAVEPPAMTGLAPITIVGINEDDDLEADVQRRKQGETTSTAGPIVDLNINVNAPRALFVRGRGLESEWQTNLNIIGTLNEPLILGSVNIRKGTIDFAGRRFDVTDGIIRFDRLTPNNPSLDLRAAYETANDVTAAIVIGGRANAPDVGLQSTPTLPSDDIMALILFGKPANELTALESLQIAETLASLSGVSPLGGGGPGLLSSARNALGVDMLNVDFDTLTGSSALTVGKYVANGLFVSATQSAGGDGGAVRVEYELGTSFTVETELEQSGDQTVSANWKKDF